MRSPSLTSRPVRAQAARCIVLTPSADLTPLFNWNTKQLFIYFVAEYQTADYVREPCPGPTQLTARVQPVNQVVIWDRIVKRKADARINLSGAKNKYAFKEISNTFSCVRSLCFCSRDPVAGTSRPSSASSTT
jgi:hypothetical protein